MSESDPPSNLAVRKPPPSASASTSKLGGGGGGSSPTGVFLGPGLAYEAVSQASAMVVQDAATMMRALGAVTTAALSVITENIVKTEGAPQWVTAFGAVTTNLATAATTFTQVGTAAAQVMAMFQPGASVPPPSPGGGGGTGNS